MTSDPQGKFRCLESPGMVAFMRKTESSPLPLSWLLTYYYGHTQYSTPPWCARKIRPVLRKRNMNTWHHLSLHLLLKEFYHGVQSARASTYCSQLTQQDNYSSAIVTPRAKAVGQQLLTLALYQLRSLKLPPLCYQTLLNKGVNFSQRMLSQSWLIRADSVTMERMMSQPHPFKTWSLATMSLLTQ